MCRAHKPPLSTIFWCAAWRLFHNDAIYDHFLKKRQWSEYSDLSITYRTLITYVPHRGRFCIWFRAGGLWTRLPVQSLSRFLAGGVRKRRNCRTETTAQLQEFLLRETERQNPSHLNRCSSLPLLPRIRLSARAGRGRYFTALDREVLFELRAEQE